MVSDTIYSKELINHVIDVYVRFVVATLNSTSIDTKLALNTLKMA